ncbi:MAG: hypothetical protein HKP55_12525 [Gammaproteobacteria bacterium]|nr:hypothetical protein [Gammaproteobacteria bacterium]
MQDKIKRLADRIDALTLRERVLIFAALLVAMHQVWDFLFWTPMVERQDALLSQEQTLNKEMLQMQIDLKLLSAKASADPDKQIKQNIETLEKQLSTLNTQIQQDSAGIVSPEQMARLLEEMLLSQKTLKLLHLETHDSVALIKPEKEKLPSVKYQIYRHDFSIEFSGSYLATLQYLETLEKLGTRFFWDAIEFGVEDFPENKVRLKLYTLSLSDAWIGV